MAIYPEAAAPYSCAICGKSAPYLWEDPRIRSLPPLCRHCENDYGVGPYNDASPDRRVIKQIGALAEAIRIDAYNLERGRSPIHG